MTGLTRRAAGLLLLALFALAIPASAAASTTTASITIPPVERGTIKADCAAPKRATGGGFLGSSPAFANLFVTESRKVGQRSWQVSAFNNTANPLPLSAYALCAKIAPRTKERSIAVPVTGLSEGSASRTCGGDSRAQAGGFFTYTDGIGGVLLGDSDRIDKRTWRTRALNTGGGSPTLIGYTYCARTKALKKKTGSFTNPLAATPSTAVSAACQTGTRLKAGGFSSPGATPADGNVYPFESLPSGRSWRASEYSGGPQRVLVASAYCA